MDRYAFDDFQVARRTVIELDVTPTNSYLVCVTVRYEVFFPSSS